MVFNSKEKALILKEFFLCFPQSYMHTDLKTKVPE